MFPVISQVSTAQTIRLRLLPPRLDDVQHRAAQSQILLPVIQLFYHEMFMAVRGSFRIEFRDETVKLNEGDFLIVPRGVEHRPVADEEAEILHV